MKKLAVCLLIAFSGQSHAQSRAATNEWSLNLFVVGAKNYVFESGASARNDGGGGIGLTLAIPPLPALARWAVVLVIAVGAWRAGHHAVHHGERRILGDHVQDEELRPFAFRQANRLAQALVRSFAAVDRRENPAVRAHQETATRFAEPFAFFGNVRLRTPSLYSALAPLASTSVGSVKLRLTMPYVRSL